MEERRRGGIKAGEITGELDNIPADVTETLRTTYRNGPARSRRV